MSNIPPLIPAVVLCLAIAACADNVSAPLAKAPVAAVAGSSAKSGLTLHPDGFGQKSLAAWRAQEGLSDTRGNANQALYFQKFTATETFAAGVARITGLEGQPGSAITGLQWEHRDDGWCGAGAPRWDIIVSDPAGNRGVIFLGCAAAAKVIVHPGWTQDTYPGAAIAAVPATGFTPAFDPTAALTISELLIVFDEGTTNLGLPYGSGYTFLDNIKVNDQTWTSPADNGGN
jgi:hypothetical protein